MISLHENSLAAGTFRPSALSYDRDTNDVTIVRRNGDTMHRILTSQCLVDIWNDDDNSFRIRFYDRAVAKFTVRGCPDSTDSGYGSKRTNSMRTQIHKPSEGEARYTAKYKKGRWT